MIRKTKDGATYGCPAPGALNIMINPAGQDFTLKKTSCKPGVTATAPFPIPALRLYIAAYQLGTKPGGPR